MKEFFKVLRRFVPPYKKYLVMSLVFTFLSAILNVFSFMVIIPILQILFKVTDTSGVVFIPWSEATSAFSFHLFLFRVPFFVFRFPLTPGCSCSIRSTLPEPSASQRLHRLQWLRPAARLHRAVSFRHGAAS